MNEYQLHENKKIMLNMGGKWQEIGNAVDEIELATPSKITFESKDKFALHKLLYNICVVPYLSTDHRKHREIFNRAMYHKKHKVREKARKRIMNPKYFRRDANDIN